jgi:2,5-diamino-6-(ribosylamino)-4(3H)-pyrimidinone 5'-phosphate reductase
MKMSRPYIIINAAMSLDGKTALPTGKQIRLSCDEDMERVHHLRHQCDAVLVGIGTVLADDPKLTVKQDYIAQPSQPLRVVLDSKGRTPPYAQVVNESAPTVIFTGPQSSLTLPNKEVDIVQVPMQKENHLSIEAILSELHQRGVRKLLVEGGGTVLWSFITSGYVDDIFIYVAPVFIGGAQTPTLLRGPGIEGEEKIIQLELQRFEQVGPGLLLNYMLIP